MIRSGFKRPQLERIKPNYARLTVPVHQARISDDVVACPKQDVVRSEPYRRLVAVKPCKACGIQGYGQAAHVPPDGKGIKQDDRETFSLCCTRPGMTGCHVEFDQYRMFSHELAVTVGRAWAADTRRQIIAEGNWPKDLPRMEGPHDC